MKDRRKQWVKDRYGSIAANSGAGCCASGSDCCGSPPTAALDIGYKSEELAQIPDGANLGLGCGNPIGIADVREGETVLDLGSGAGVDAFLAAKRTGEAGKIIGVDMTPEMIETARRNAVEAGYKRVEFRLGDIEALPVEDSSVDLVISNCVLNLVPDKRKAFQGIYRVLKPGGRIAISDIVLNGDLPECLMNDPDAYCSCVSGAIGREDYLNGLAEAGLIELGIRAESGFDIGVPGLGGIVRSITVTGRKPSDG